MTLSEFEGHFCCFEWQNASRGRCASAELLVVILVQQQLVKLEDSFSREHSRAVCAMPCNNDQYDCIWRWLSVAVAVVAIAGLLLLQILSFSNIARPHLRRSIAAWQIDSPFTTALNLSAVVFESRRHRNSFVQ